MYIYVYICIYIYICMYKYIYTYIYMYIYIYTYMLSFGSIFLRINPWVILWICISLVYVSLRKTPK